MTRGAHGWLLLGLVLAAGCADGPRPGATAGPDGPDGPAALARRKNVVFIVIDTLRADAMSLARTPNLRKLKAQGQSPTLAWSGATWTVPSVISMFTGSTVRQHGWDFPFPRFMDMGKETYAPAPSLPTLAEVLKGAGYHTVSFHNNSMLNQGLGLDRGFEAWNPTGDRNLARKLEEEVDDWDDPADPAGQPNFVYVHLLGPHHPLRPSAKACRRWGIRPKQVAKTKGLRIEDAQQGDEADQDLYRRGYYASVEDTDRVLGAVLAALGEHRENSLVVLTSDHGELLGEHGLVGHEQWVFEPLTRVPLIVAGATVTLPSIMSNTMIPDLVTQSLGLVHDWPVKLSDPLPLVAQRQGKVALSPDGKIKGIWDDEAFGAGFSSFDISQSTAEDAPLARLPFPHADAKLRMARGAWALRVPGRRLAPVSKAMTNELQEALEALGYMGSEDPLPAEPGEPTEPTEAPDAAAADAAEDG